MDRPDDSKPPVGGPLRPCREPHLWGGEVLWIGTRGIERLAALRPLPLPGGERACLEPRRIALGLLATAGPRALGHPGAGATLAAFEAGEMRWLLAMLARQVHCPWTTSLGRLFDGAASLLGLCQRLSHEGEAAMGLQGQAALGSGGPDDDGGAYPFPLRPSGSAGPPLGWLDGAPALWALLADRAAGLPVRLGAARFQRGLAAGWADLLQVAAAATAAEVTAAEVTAAAAAAGPEQAGRPIAEPSRNPAAQGRVVLAGGCFQNAPLLEALIGQLRRRGLEPHWAESLPGNDGGLALGQLQAWRWSLARPLL